MGPDLLTAALLLAALASGLALATLFVWWTLKSADAGRRLARFARRLVRRVLLLGALAAAAYAAL
jgi:hypothetical protein